MPQLSEAFASQAYSCKEVLGSGSCLLVSNVGFCGDEPRVFTLTTSAAASATTNPSSVFVDLSAVTQDGVAVTPITGLSVVIRADSFLYFGVSNTPVQVTKEVKITAGTNAEIEVASIPTTIGITANARTWGMDLLDTVTDLPLNLEAGETDRKDLKAGLQGSNIKTRVDLNIPVTYFASPLDKTQAKIMLRGAMGSEDIYFVAAKSSGLIAFGRAKVMGLSESGDDQLTTYTTTLSAQAPFSVAQRTTDTDINSTTQITTLNTVFRLAGLTTI